jgi:hypothetical protein
MFYSTDPWSSIGRQGRESMLDGPSFGIVPAFLANIRLGWKGLPRTDALTQLTPSPVTKKKSFITLAPDLSDLELI